MPSQTLQTHPQPVAVTRRIADIALFLLAWMRDPRGVAAIAPSGRTLAALITREIGPAIGPVLELGPGTGAFTKALIHRGVAENHLTLIEYGARFAGLLRHRFPAAKVIEMDAADLTDLSPVDQPRYGAVICGLGLLNMPEDKVEAILRGAFARMRQGAPFFLFTYGRRCAVPDAVLARLGLIATRVATTFLNVPPATVYRLTRIHQMVR